MRDRFRHGPGQHAPGGAPAPGVPSCSASSSCSRASRRAWLVLPSAMSASTASARQPANTGWTGAQRASSWPRPRGRRPARPRAGAAPAAAAPGSATGAVRPARRRRSGQLARGGKGLVGSVRSVRLHQRVDEDRQAPQPVARCGRPGSLTECQPGVPRRHGSARRSAPSPGERSRAPSARSASRAAARSQ